MDRQLVELVDARLPAAVVGLERELEDDLHDVETAVRGLAESVRLKRALARGDRDEALAALHVFEDEHPNLDILVFDPQGALFVQLGCAAPPEHTRRLAGMPRLGTADGASARGVSPNGCETFGDEAPPAVLVVRRMTSGAIVVVCLPLDDALVEHVAEKIGVELAAIDPNDATLRARTDAFPERLLARAGPEMQLHDDEARSWAIRRVELDPLLGPSDVSVVVALDVTEVHAIVRRNLALASAFVLLVALIALYAGGRIARTMSGAIRRVGDAMRKLEDAEYVHVTGVATGDELEDLASGFNTMVDGLRERDNLRATFGKYMTASVMEHLLSGKVQLGGETQTATVLFADIRSFTTLSEAMDAQALVSLLNEYFTEMVSIIIQEGGVVDKYIGDAIMAVFGPPVPAPDDAVRAVRAAVRMRGALAELNKRLAARGTPILCIGIGVHTGEVVAGNIGSEARMEYTVIGDAVNVASRLETATKELGADIVLSGETHALVEATCVTRFLDEISVKGRTAPVRVYAVDELHDA
ncbi:MAG: adenylate/guanylate cyclase domain-containing protein [Sandaracinaceae bacterium]|nr:adenylate/guanylate cyclase domain-containing protein [Sandaracinaceae bacterium]